MTPTVITFLLWLAIAALGLAIGFAHRGQQ
jgi:hypothetical protein